MPMLELLSSVINIPAPVLAGGSVPVSELEDPVPGLIGCFFQ